MKLRVERNLRGKFGAPTASRSFAAISYELNLRVRGKLNLRGRRNLRGELNLRDRHNVRGELNLRGRRQLLRRADPPWHHRSFAASQTFANLREKLGSKARPRLWRAMVKLRSCQS